MHILDNLKWFQISAGNKYVFRKFPVIIIFSFLYFWYFCSVLYERVWWPFTVLLMITSSFAEQKINHNVEDIVKNIEKGNIQLDGAATLWTFTSTFTLITYSVFKTQRNVALECFVMRRSNILSQKSNMKTKHFVLQRFGLNSAHMYVKTLWYNNLLKTNYSATVLQCPAMFTRSCPWKCAT